MRCSFLQSAIRSNRSRIRRRCIAAHLANVPQIDLGKTYGDFAQGNAVEAIRVPGVDHVTIVNSPDAATTIVKWLDSTFGTARTGAIEVKDARRGSARFALLMFVFLLVPFGRRLRVDGAGLGGRAAGAERMDGATDTRRSAVCGDAADGGESGGVRADSGRQYPDLLVHGRGADHAGRDCAVADAGLEPHPRRAWAPRCLPGRRVSQWCTYARSRCP